MNDFDYWEESISSAAEECNLKLTESQLACLANHIKISHENYSLAFYTPPSSDRLNNIKKEFETKYNELKNEYDKYRENAEMAVKRALRQDLDSDVCIVNHGDVYRYGGRTEQIQ